MSVLAKGILLIKVITKLPNSEQSYKGKVKTHNYINRQNHIYHIYIDHLLDVEYEIALQNILNHRHSSVP